jgi:hypothetical protein
MSNFGSSVTVTTSTETTVSADGIQTTRRVSTTTTTTVNVSQRDQETADRMSDPQNIDYSKVVTGETDRSSNLPSSRPPISRDRLIPDVSGTAITPALAQFRNGDRRVRLLVPASYLIGQAAGPLLNSTSNQGILALNGGIVFPYTPSISLSHQAAYKDTSAVHSNYMQYFYQNSSVSDITLTAKFTVQNEVEGAIYLATQHLLRVLTKMPFGTDPTAGSPPPVCRLIAHGNYMLDFVPVVIKSFKSDYKNDVDYITIDPSFGYGLTSVPVVSEISLTMSAVYSRNEMLNASVQGWLTGNQRTQGYL